MYVYLLLRKVYIYIVRMEVYSMCERATVSRAREYESERTHVAIPSLVCACVSRYAKRRCATRCSLSLFLSTAARWAESTLRETLWSARLISLSFIYHTST